MGANLYGGEENMKILQVGLGSMGKRRIRNLQQVKAGEIIGFDPREDRRKEAEEKYKIRTFDDFEEAMAENPDALVISTPPDLHMKYAIIAAKRNKHFFTELNVVDTGMKELIDLCKGKKIVAAPSTTMLHHPAVQKIMKLVDNGVIGKPLTFTYHSGQYLADWHPWEDYRKFYVSKKETGAARELVSFELVWLTRIFGGIKTVSGFAGKLSNLETDIDDTYQILLRFKNGVWGHMLVDVIARAPYRVFKLLGSEGVIEWDWNTKIVKVFTVKDKKWKEYQTEHGEPEKGYVWTEKMYIDEMNHFAKAIKGDVKYMYSFEEDHKILKTVYAAEESSKKGKHVDMTGVYK